jgi:hypothetical protein
MKSPLLCFCHLGTASKPELDCQRLPFNLVAAVCPRNFKVEIAYEGTLQFSDPQIGMLPCCSYVVFLFGIAFGLNEYSNPFKVWGYIEVNFRICLCGEGFWYTGQ